MTAQPSAAYCLCPHCFRAVPAHSAERFCANDGHVLIDHCPVCGASITSPYAHYCVHCGLDFAALDLKRVRR